MKLAYVDSSCILAIAFDEPGAETLSGRLSRYDRLFASNLLEAEVRSAFRQERVSEDAAVFSGLSWIHPDRPLTAEYEQITAIGYLKGADLWHLACALFLAPDAKGLAFLTLDVKQKEAARKLGFSS